MDLNIVVAVVAGIIATVMLVSAGTRWEYLKRPGLRVGFGALFLLLMVLSLVGAVDFNDVFPKPTPTPVVTMTPTPTDIVLTPTAPVETLIPTPTLEPLPTEISLGGIGVDTVQKYLNLIASGDLEGAWNLLDEDARNVASTDGTYETYAGYWTDVYARSVLLGIGSGGTVITVQQFIYDRETHAQIGPSSVIVFWVEAASIPYISMMEVR